MARILFAMPMSSDGGVRPRAWSSTMNMDWGDNDVYSKDFLGYSSKARNNAIWYMLDHKYDYCLMVDSDNVIPMDALTNLIEIDEPLVMGWCAQQGHFKPPHGDGNTCLYKDPKHQFTGEELKALAASGAHKVPIFRGGMACALIRRDAVERTAFPWFKYVEYENRGNGALSEDYFFCKKLREAGIQPYGDARVACGHYFRHVEYL